MTIMIVEDDDTILFTLALFLENQGYKVITAENGAVALELLKDCELPSLIFLDMTMPVLSGPQFAAAFKTLYSDTVPLIAMTAATDAQKLTADIGAADCITKPFSLESVVSVIKKYNGQKLI